MSKFLNISTDNTLGGNAPSDIIVSSQKAIKEYVDSQSGGSGGYHPDLFTWQWADHELNDVQWLRADTFSWQSGAVYQAAYQHLADDIDGKTLQSETVGSTTIQFYLADDGHKICPAGQESNVAAIYNATGVAWYYILDTANQRFKLPRTQFGVTGLRDTVGNYVAAGLPDHNHTVGIPINGGWNGTIYIGGSDQNTVQTTKTFTSSNASASNSIYGNSTTVQPPATQMYLYFYVGNFTQTALENTAGLNTELFNDKADLDFGNTTMIDYVVEKQDPTSSNNYTWYRKYKSGWVEQGGEITSNTVNDTVNLLVEMADTHYFTTVHLVSSQAYSSSTGTLNINGCNTLVGTINRRGTTSFYISYPSSSDGRSYMWEVKGIAAN